MRYMLDTNIISYYLRRTSSALEERVNEGLKKRNIAMSAIARAELRFGQMGMQHDDRRRSLIDGFLLRLPSIEFSAEAADRYGFVSPALNLKPLRLRKTDVEPFTLEQVQQLVPILSG